MCCKSLSYRILSKTLENAGSREIGLQFATLSLSPFLYIGLIIEYFNWVGKVPDSMALLQL
jgi:hypothetical protein